MTHVASKELCKELYEQSGWDEVFLSHHLSDLARIGPLSRDVRDAPRRTGDGVWLSPAYDLGYLLRKLPDFLQRYGRLTIQPHPNYTKQTKVQAVPDFSILWYAEYGSQELRCSADTPEDAAAMLAIHLFKRGVLVRQTA